MQFYVDDTEEIFRQKLVSDEGFRRLNEIGGFELLRCQSNCRLLEPINVKWTPESLRSTIGCQAKLFIRPIQRCLSLESVVQISSPLQLKEKCILCKNDFTITELRAHLENCEKSDKVQDDTSDQTTGVPEQAETVQDDNLDQTRTDAQQKDADMDQHTESDNDDVPRLYPPPPRVTEETVTDESPLQQAITSCIDICTKKTE